MLPDGFLKRCAKAVAKWCSLIWTAIRWFFKAVVFVYFLIMLLVALALTLDQIMRALS